MSNPALISVSMAEKTVIFDVPISAASSGIETAHTPSDCSDRRAKISSNNFICSNSNKHSSRPNSKMPLGDRKIINNSNRKRLRSSMTGLTG